MGSLKEVRNRITSVNGTKQITAAMKMASAAKLRRAQDAIVRMRPYAEKLSGILSSVSASLSAGEGVYSKPRKVERMLVVAIASNRGLAGAFNAQVARSVKRQIAEHAAAEVKVLGIGKKAIDAFRRTKWHAKELPEDLASLFEGLSFNKVAPVAELVMHKYAAGDYDKVVLVYNKFKNAATQVLTEEQYLPVRPAEANTPVGRKAAGFNADHLMEPSREVIVEQLVPKSLKIQLYKALLDSHAAEHGARMTAMHKATDNADALLKDLRLSYNKARQAAITNEILEIVGGAEALKG